LIMDGRPIGLRPPPKIDRAARENGGLPGMGGPARRRLCLPEREREPRSLY
jgi:hypothetical protein